jgi:NADPH:quinone reductase
MKSVVYSETGDPSVLREIDREPDEPGPGEVRIRLARSGVNPTDWKSRRGQGAGRTGDGERVTGLDGAGVVDAFGPGVDAFAVGDRVWTTLAAYQRPMSGTAQEYTVLPLGRVFALPDAASFDVGASLGVPAMTAHRALTVAEGGPEVLAPGALAGRTVLVSGGAGAVGHAAIQLARWAGATVITTVSSPEKQALARAAGAQHALNYHDSGLAESIRAVAPEGVDVIVEVAASANYDLDLSVLATRGTIASYGNDRGGALEIDFGRSVGLNARYQFVLLYTMGQEAVDAAARDINAALADGALAVGEAAGLPITRFPLEQTAAAHDAVEGGAVGKVLIDVTDGDTADSRATAAE